MDRGPADDLGRSAALRRRLLGRDGEIAAIERSLDDARAGRGAGIMAVIGDCGFGKSALLEHAAARADDMRVLWCVGAPAEAALAFAGLLQMVRPLLNLISRLPRPQAAAIRSVFGLSEDRVEDRFLISVAVLSLLSDTWEMWRRKEVTVDGTGVARGGRSPQRLDLVPNDATGVRGVGIRAALRGRDDVDGVSP